MDTKKLVLFDFDGVIVDTFEMCFEVGQIVLPGIERERYRSMFDGNIYEAVEDYDGVVNRDDKKYFQNYLHKLLELAPVEGIEGELEKLSSKYPLIIVTSSMGASVQEYLQKFSLEKHFFGINGFDKGASKIKKILSALQEYKVRPKDAVFITDTLGDMREAEHVGVPCIGVTWGFQRRENLEKGGPDAIVSDVENLAEVVEGVLEGPKDHVGEVGSP
ncbi:MAG: HAD family hydrolase [bacterium]|nr:HAD family hydrolase [bacterium]